MDPLPPALEGVKQHKPMQASGKLPKFGLVRTGPRAAGATRESSELLARTSP